MQSVTSAPSARIERHIHPPGERRFTLATPEEFSKEGKVPLILALHFGGPVTPYYGEQVLTGLVEPALRELNALIVAPDCTGDSWQDPQSEQDVLELLETIQHVYAIDTQRTLVCGYSMGGVGCWHLAARHPQRFRAALIVSAGPPDDALDMDWQIPSYVIHSDQDEWFPLQGTQQVVAELQDRGAPVKLVVVEGLTHFDVGRFITPLREAAPWVRRVWDEY